MNYIIDLSSPFIWVFLVGTIAHSIWNAWLSWRDKDYILKTEDDALEKVNSLHPTASKFFTPEKMKLSLAYERVCRVFGAFESKCGKIFGAILLAFGFFPWLLSVFNREFNLSFLVAFIAATLVVSLIDTITDVPFDLHSTFSIEKRFGFNTTTKKIFWMDLLKNELVSNVVQIVTFAASFGLLYAYHCLFGKIGLVACLCGAAIFTATSMLFEVVYMKVVLPIFNKLEPMEDGELKTKMEEMMRKFGFSPNGVFVMDASKRSKHSNAYCSGWGKSKRLVLFDTLLENMNNDEILAILGHELAHSKLHHLVYNRVIDFATIFIYYFVASYFVYSTSMLDAFGYRGAAIPCGDLTSTIAMTSVAFIGFKVFEMLWGSFDWLLTGLKSWISRKMEFAADKYSCLYTGKVDPMITALFKLYGENLTYPLSDQLFESWLFSHPGLVNRVEALKRVEKEICK